MRKDKPEYVMGIGYPLEIVVRRASGADLYDYVYPTRTALFGSALVGKSVPDGSMQFKLENRVLKLKQNAMVIDERPIDPSCPYMGQMEKVASPQVDVRCSSDRFCLTWLAHSVHMEGDVSLVVKDLVSSVIFCSTRVIKQLVS
ncbi:hypothetical protein CFC21_053856 [Triticum aestivum]|uniref:tRNA-guanine(15) transglycosylase-like domain-containing protein n=2 Tax=Triticum aestivum TaxID=4565 RepID=A0A9R1GDI3_WHEAT|nr:queuine tRNA-ribosyltransferase-like [Triticum dicoccoides]XP_037422620.1 queuine tRNA-ribosyltransferase-like [Triticum dicoccoides]XP_037422622.1 queuine tRNA-ribosyltransferase-like [Triticum dicoccoides]XP_037422623.1 queuine tRNA-ribosyltransferase-like [Triticum dicoccoides]XP_044365346.1 queuine tRNA-ribosyltransferase-like isoform X1 [Triticum aestivum]XP_044365347.1 queuine tRNA-ribosyltransferase-like isoform X1 [Triticum aestivum]KAF7044657.1 hypothetical protein CFC21_053856 [T